MSDSIPARGPSSVSSEPPLQLSGIGLSLGRTSLDALEQVLRGLTDVQLGALLGTAPEVWEFGTLRTCQRLEVYVLADRGFSLRSALGPLAPDWGGWSDREAVQHLFRVAGGLESLAVGEPEVREQVQRASERIVTRSPRGVLRSVFRAATGAAGTMPTPRAAQSVAALAATKLLEEVGTPFPRVLIVGAGTVGQKVAECLAPFARLTIVYRSRPPAPAFLRETGARVVPMNALADELEVSDAVVTAAKSSGRLLGLDEVRPRTHPLVAVDLGVPRNIDPVAADQAGVRRFDLESLRRPRAFAAVHDQLAPYLDTAALKSWESLQPELWEPAIGQWRFAVEELRRDELARARRFIGAVSEEQWLAVERLTERLARRILEPTTARLRGLGGGAADLRTRRTVLDFVTPDRPFP